MIIPNIWENKIDVPNHQPVSFPIMSGLFRLYCDMDNLDATGSLVHPARSYSDKKKMYACFVTLPATDSVCPFTG